jgi:hypothetical protein
MSGYSTCVQDNLSLTIGTNNRFTTSGFSYDAAGNMLGDGFRSYAYDAENRIKTYNSTGAAYTYDANGQRVYKQVGSDTTEYIYSNGQPIAERKASGNWSDYIYSGSRRIARADNYDARIHMSGVNCVYSVCGYRSSGGYLPVASGIVVRSGDFVWFRGWRILCANFVLPAHTTG